MRFTPKSEAELSTPTGFEPFPAGEYPFEVLEATEEISKSSGNPMVKLNIAIFNDEGRKRFVYDYLVGSERALFKVRGFAEAAGMLDSYERGEMMPEDMVGRTGKCRVVVDNNPEFGAKNKIAAYVKPADLYPKHSDMRKQSMFQPKKAPAMAGSYAGPVRGNDLDDDIPFAPCWQ